MKFPGIFFLLSSVLLVAVKAQDSTWTGRTPALCSNTQRELFDYVIIGGGTAGSVLAARLSENPDVTVLLLEQGGTPSSYPAETQFIGRSPRQTLETWKDAFLTSTINTKTSSLFGAPEALHGTGLGGTSNINAGIWSEPQMSDFDAWNLTGWSGKETYPYLAKARAQLNISPPGAQQTLSAAVLNVMSAIGVPVVDDTKMNLTGIRAPRTANYQGKRLSSFDAYVAPILQSRQNLIVRTGVSLQQLRFRSQPWRTPPTAVKSVEYFFQANLYRAVVGKEVIISAGVYDSPKILLSCGIGPAAEIQSMGDVIQDLPGVGKNLVARPLANVLFSGGSTPVPEMDFQTLLNPATINNFVANGKGPYAMPVSGAWGNMMLLPTSTKPDTFLLFTDMTPIGSAPPPSMIGTCVTLDPASRGSVTLRSPTITDDPVIDLKLFANPADLAPLIACINLWRNIFAAATATHAFTAGVELAPGASVTDPTALAGYIMSSSYWAYHAYGTCKMGTASDPMAVVDTRLKVFGIRNLRVVDASVIPGRFSSGPMALVYTIAEKAADMIIADNLV